MDSYNPADLTSVLNTLSSLTNPPREESSAHDDDDTYEPPEPSPSHPNTHTTHTSQSHPTPNPVPQPKQLPKPSTDPTKITTYPPALRHIITTISSNDDALRRLRRLIADQHAHERSWWEGREALVQKLNVRGVKKGEVERVLRSVGAPVSSTADIPPEDTQTELQNYDKKVYQASIQMSDALHRELKVLGVPFFAIRPDLICHDQGHPPDGRLSPAELSALQRRVLELLQDLCRE